MLTRPEVTSPLAVVCVGTGRDGTTSLAQMMQSIFDQEGGGRTVMHEWKAVEFYGHFCTFKEANDERVLDEIRRSLAECPYDCIVGNGYASIFPLFAEVFGRGLKLVHLRRDRAQCVSSMARNVELFPVNHLYYANSPVATGKRIAAFHYGEATRQEWDSWSVERRLFWYYDKTHALIDSATELFADVLDIETESLDDTKVRAALGRISETGITPRAVHVNQHFNLDDLPEEPRPWVQRLLGKLDLQRLADEPAYGLQHFSSEFIYWMSSSVDGAIPRERMIDILSDARETLLKGLYEIEALEGNLARPHSGVSLETISRVVQALRRSLGPMARTLRLVSQD
jgi:hypothetical protein